MLDIIFVLLFLFAVVLMFYSIMERNIAFMLMTSILWFILALFILQGIEIPGYTNYDSVTGDFTTGVQTIQTNLDPLAYLFMGFGIILFIVTITFMLEYLTDYKRLSRR